MYSEGGPFLAHVHVVHKRILFKVVCSLQTMNFHLNCKKKLTKVHIAAEPVIYLPVSIVKLNLACVQFHVVSKQVTAAGIAYSST